MSTFEGSFLAKAMELCNSMMQFSGCELYSHNTRTLLAGLNNVLNTIDGHSTQVGCIRLLVDTLIDAEQSADESLNEEGYSDFYDDELDRDDYETYDWPEDYLEDNECYGPDPMYSAEDAFAYLDEQEYLNAYDKDAYLNGDTIEDMAALDERHDNDDEIESWANTAHDDLNLDLQEAIATKKNVEASIAIWHAREHMMNKIVFSDGDFYPVHRVSFEVDENGIPVDIVISTRLKYLKYIAANHCQLGYNCGDDEEHGFYTALYGRLDKFSLYDYEGNLLWEYKKPTFSF